MPDWSASVLILSTFIYKTSLLSDAPWKAANVLGSLIFDACHYHTYFCWNWIKMAFSEKIKVSRLRVHNRKHAERCVVTCPLAWFDNVDLGRQIRKKLVDFRRDRWGSLEGLFCGLMGKLVGPVWLARLLLERAAFWKIDSDIRGNIWFHLAPSTYRNSFNVLILLQLVQLIFVSIFFDILCICIHYLSSCKMWKSAKYWCFETAVPRSTQWVQVFLTKLCIHLEVHSTSSCFRSRIARGQSEKNGQIGIAPPAAHMYRMVGTELAPFQSLGSDWHDFQSYDCAAESAAQQHASTCKRKVLPDSGRPGYKENIYRFRNTAASREGAADAVTTFNRFFYFKQLYRLLRSNLWSKAFVGCCVHATSIRSTVNLSEQGRHFEAVRLDSWIWGCTCFVECLHLYSRGDVAKACLKSGTRKSCQSAIGHTGWTTPKTSSCTFCLTFGLSG